MKYAFIIFMVLYAAALFLFLVGTYGWFGQEPGPLAGVFLMPIGLPWNVLGSQTPLPGPVVGLLAPAVNAGILFWLWKR